MLREGTRLGALLLLIVSHGSDLAARPRERVKTEKTDDQIVVIVRDRGHGPEFQIDTEKYTKDRVKLFLGEQRLTRKPNTPVVFLLQDTVPLAGLRLVAEMAVNAGFTNVHAYVYWTWNKKMAEIQFGPVAKFSKDPRMSESACLFFDDHSCQNDLHVESSPSQ
jgi:hypothetical protein